MWIRGRRCLDIRRMLPLSRCQGVREKCQDGQSDLTVLALPDKVCFALAAADLVLLEAADGDEVGVCFAT